MKLYSPAFEKNRDPIIAVLKEALTAHRSVLEIGSGSGQHVAWFARHFDQVSWFPTDLEEHLESIECWRVDSGLANIKPAQELNLLSGKSPDTEVDAIITINTFHIVSWPGVQSVFELAADRLPVNGILFVYGAFRYAERALEPSNVQFNAWLKARDPESGIREFEQVDRLARDAGLALVEDRAMPSNNRAIWWRKTV